MFNLKLFVPVLALAAMALPAGASVVTYCSGTSAYCETNDQTAFTSALTADSYTLAALETFSQSGLSAGQYTDSNGILFYDYTGQALTVNGSSSLVVPSGSNAYLEIVLPATVAAIQLSATAGDQLCLDAQCPAANGFVGFVNPTPGAQWQVEIVAYDSNLGYSMTVTNFDVATAGTQGGGGGETPEVATFILIGSGLLAMRWMRRLPKRFFRTPQPAC